ncbi:arylalkylamine N-acetyltransferase-like 2 [Osmia lignaria lignaria]|uniref:arylalkylamine N-acetyltransferase-like 2 n=1 Tax=Osmia lignaria lignaria TaxID=1437193 RepID=UPI00147948C0|nr:uncharacterized protein LOC117609189 [Osmia lignaria]
MSVNEETNPPVSFPIKPPGPPKVWRVIETVIKGKENAPIKFSIQEIPEDRYDEVADYMCTYFIPDEPMCKCSNGKNDPEFAESFRELWKKVLKHGLSIAAFTENPNGGKPIIAAVNVLVFCHKDDKEDYADSMPIKPRRILDVVLDISKKAQVYEKYGVDRYMGAFGLSVHPSYRGSAMGGHLLRAREDVGREYNIEVTSTGFTSPISQKLAERCGFETLIEQNYEELVDEKGNLLFPGIEAKTLKIMAKRLY